MRKLLANVFATIIALCILSGVVNAAVYTFQPSSMDLAHDFYYTWGISKYFPSNEYITGAQLVLRNVYDSAIEANDHLYIHLLDNVSYGVRVFQDGQVQGDNFAGQGILIADWTDEQGGAPYNPPLDLVYTFSREQIESLTNYVSNGNFGFGFDPDCHYHIDGMSFRVTTAVPEPGSMLLLGMGLIGLTGVARKKLVKK